jgi:hypothetical protein
LCDFDGVFLGVDEEGEAITRARILGVRLIDREAVLYAIVETTDLLNEWWGVGAEHLAPRGAFHKQVGEIRDAAGKKFKLFNARRDYAMGPSQVRVLELNFGEKTKKRSEKEFWKIDLAGVQGFKLDDFEGVKEWIPAQ